MGRLRKGQSLILSMLEKGEIIFPPVPPTSVTMPKARRRTNRHWEPAPQTENSGDSSEGSDAETINVQSENEEEVELLPRQLRCRIKSQREPLLQTKKPGGRRKGGDAETVNLQSEKRRANSQSKPLPQTKKRGGSSETVDAETVNMHFETEEEVELPTRLQKRRANSQSKPLAQTKKPRGRRGGGDAETVNMKSKNEEEVELPPPLVRSRANSQSEPLPQNKKQGGRNERGDAETIYMQSENEEAVELPPPLQRHRANSQSKPLPQTKKPADTINMLSENEEEVELPPPLQRHTANSHSEPLHQTKKPGGRSEGGDAKTVSLQSENEEKVDLPPPLLRLYRIPNTTLNKNQLPEVIRQAYASAAASVKKALVCELKSRDNFDVESMVDLANDAFVSLGSLHADFGDLYNSVRDFIQYHWQLSEAKKELRMKGCILEMEVHYFDLCDQSDKAHKALLGANISLAETENEIVQIREILNDLEEKLKEGNEKIGAWQEECNRLEKSYEEAKAKEQNSAKQLAEHKRILELINSRHDKAMADIERTMFLLSSMCELNNDQS
ncbi:uncharacterized protein LOC112489237 isoform X1 [Ziziphus jujuba]|uniref:Uncharacterized protein LOC112489237 isoform X1 n=1 Tax=Ziziphus jujuba TaxID=326968 RepID=A0A6P6FM49_ZIZJJ|nr:uncharacterized protein LOC112489237 isoform X1 [Ziziphus jujuba]